MLREIPIPPPDFRCKDPKTWIEIEIRKLERKIRGDRGFCTYLKLLEYERKLATLKSYLE